MAGLMEEALAQASGTSTAEIRRAVMLEGDLGKVARVVLVEGRSGLGR